MYKKNPLYKFNSENVIVTCYSNLIPKSWNFRNIVYGD